MSTLNRYWRVSQTGKGYKNTPRNFFSLQNEQEPDKD
jgi:hypothetical protein